MLEPTGMPIRLLSGSCPAREGWPSVTGLRLGDQLNLNKDDPIMQYGRHWVLVGVLCGLAGCSQSAPEKKPDGGMEVNWPGGSFKYDPKKGVQVNAPGVEVEVGKESGVGVKAPGTEVKVNKDEGVNVQTPGADVQVK
jgi:hypothetical protein